jgi:hypothetical protein
VTRTQGEKNRKTENQTKNLQIIQASSKAKQRRIDSVQRGRKKLGRKMSRADVREKKLPDATKNLRKQGKPRKEMKIPHNIPPCIPPRPHEPFTQAATRR